MIAEETIDYFRRWGDAGERGHMLVNVLMIAIILFSTQKFAHRFSFICG